MSRGSYIGLNYPDGLSGVPSGVLVTNSVDLSYGLGANINSHQIPRGGELKKEH